MRTAEADQSLRAMLSSGQDAEGRAHVAQVAARRECRPFRGGRVFSELWLEVAIHRRYTDHPLLGVPYGSLQGVTVRSVPCNYYVMQSVVALSRRKRGFKSRRGRHLFSHLHAKALG
jgi:hypothetical protein